MRQIIIQTLIADFLSCLLCGIIIGIDESWVVGFYVSVLLFGGFLIPTLLATIIFLLLKNKTTLSTTRVTMVFQSVLLSVIFVSGLFIWAIFDVVIFSSETEHVFAAIVADFKSQFGAFTIVAVFQAIIIPIIHRLLNAPQTSVPIVSHNS